MLMKCILSKTTVNVEEPINEFICYCYDTTYTYLKTVMYAWKRQKDCLEHRPGFLSRVFRTICFYPKMRKEWVLFKDKVMFLSLAPNRPLDFLYNPK